MAYHSMMAHDADAAVMRMYFEEIELELLKMIKKHSVKGKTFTADDWIMNQSREVRRLRNEMESYGLDVTTEFSGMLDGLIDDVYGDYSDGFRSEFEAAGSFGFNAISLDTLNTLKNEQKRLFNQAFGKYINQNVQDYQKTMNEAVKASVQVESGNKSFYDAVRDGVIASAENGLTGFTDTAGKKWTMPTYMDMFVKTTMFNVANQALFDEMQDHNHDLMIMSQHAGACPVCSAWQGKIISMNGSDRRYPSYDDLVNAGVFHPNCEHTIAPYFPGFTQVEDAIPYDPDKYQARQKQRYYERQMRKWRRVEAVADGSAKKVAREKVNENYTKLMDHIDANDLKRNPQRERIMQVERNVHAKRQKERTADVNKKADIPKVVKPPKAIGTNNPKAAEPKATTKKAVTKPTKTYSAKQIDAMSEKKLKEVARDLSLRFHSSGKTGISYGGRTPQEVTDAMMVNQSKAALKNSIKSMQRSLKKWESE